MNEDCSVTSSFTSWPDLNMLAHIKETVDFNYSQLLFYSWHRDLDISICVKRLSSFNIKPFLFTKYFDKVGQKIKCNVYQHLLHTGAGLISYGVVYNPSHPPTTLQLLTLCSVQFDCLWKIFTLSCESCIRCLWSKYFIKQSCFAGTKSLCL